MVEKKLTVAGFKATGKRNARAPVAAPPGTELVDAGSCKIFIRPERDRRSVYWRGGCAGGLADGDGRVEIIYANSREAHKVSAKRGVLEDWKESYSRTDSGQTARYSYEKNAWATIPRAKVSQWATGFLDQHSAASAQAAGQQATNSGASPQRILVPAGECRILAFPNSAASNTFLWRGPCVDGIAHGQGVLEIHRPGLAAINLQTFDQGRSVAFQRYQYDGSQYQRQDWDGKNPTTAQNIPANALPTWAARLQTLYAEGLGKDSGTLAAEQRRAAEERAASRAREAAAAQAREEEEAREARERRRREDEEDDRQARREAQEREDQRNRQWMDATTAIMAGAAAARRQQEEQNAQREAQRRRIEADNARYRQQRAEDDRRRLVEQNQRQQQAALERQADVQRQRAAEERRRPRQERVNLPKHTGCIRIEWARNVPQATDQWYTLHNTCAYPLEVHWCDRPGCQRSNAAATIHSGGNTRSWLLKKNGVSVTVVAACQTDNGGATVYYNANENQCWSMVTMQ